MSRMSRTDKWFAVGAGIAVSLYLTLLVVWVVRCPDVAKNQVNAGISIGIPAANADSLDTKYNEARIEEAFSQMLCHRDGAAPSMIELGELCLMLGLFVIVCRLVFCMLIGARTSGGSMLGLSMFLIAVQIIQDFLIRITIAIAA